MDKTRVNSLSDGKGSVLLKDYAGNEKQVSVYAVDYSGNQSETVKLDNPYYKEPKKTEPDAGKQTVSNTDTSSPAPSGAILREAHRKAVIKSRSQELLLTRQKHRHREKKRKALCRRVRLRRTVPERSWILLRNRKMINSFIPLRQKQEMCSIL